MRLFVVDFCSSALKESAKPFVARGRSSELFGVAVSCSDFSGVWRPRLHGLARMGLLDLGQGIQVNTMSKVLQKIVSSRGLQQNSTLAA